MTVKDEVVARALEMATRRENTRAILRFLATQFLDERKLGARQSRDLLRYEGRLDSSVKRRELTIDAAIHRHVKYLERLAAKPAEAGSKS